MKQPTLTAKLGKYILGALMLAFFTAGLGATPALAQEDQAYKEAFNAGLEAYQAKNVNEAYNQWVRAAELAEQAGDADVAQKAMSYVTQLDYARGLQAYKQENYQEALQHFEAGLQHDPTYTKHYYGQGLTLKKLDRFDDAIAAYMKAAEGGDRQVAQTAEDAIRKEYIFLASSKLAEGGENPTRSQAQQAVEYLTQMQEYVEPDADAYYYLAEAYKTLGDYGQAIEAADQGLEVHRGSRTDKAKLYFVKGESLMFQGNNTAAIEAFREAAFGSYKAPAEHFIETLSSS